MKITLSASDQAKAGDYTVVLANPAPGGGGSNVKYFTVNSAAAAVLPSNLPRY
jgi:hypothetical protein